MDGQVADQTAGHNGCIEMEFTSYLKAARVEPLRLQMHLQTITTMHRALEVGLAMHHRQGHRRPPLLASASREDTAGGDAVALQALLPGLMAPAQQLVKVHHTGGISVAEMHLTFKLEPVVGGGHGSRR